MKKSVSIVIFKYLFILNSCLLFEPNYLVMQNLKKDIREANKKNKMLKYLRKKAQERKQEQMLKEEHLDT